MCYNITASNHRITKHVNNLSLSHARLMSNIFGVNPEISKQFITKHPKVHAGYLPQDQTKHAMIYTSAISYFLFGKWNGTQTNTDD